MFLNIALFFLIFVAAKKKFSALGGSLLLGAIKGASYYFYHVSKNLNVALIAAAGTALVTYLLVTTIQRLDKPGADGKPPEGFRWEYIGIAVFAFLFLVGEFVFGLRALALGA
ncbi:MAG TPA: hypothetical protein VFJ90_12555 [Candidatus Didemnitutus sp.]|nr:hypothetical protein [Candidatus Didemnitutus sp.]